MDSLNLNKSKRSKKIFIWVLLFVFVAFVTFVLVRMFTDPAEFKAVLDYNLPEFNQTDGLQNLFGERYAVALDGDIIYANNDEPHPTASTAKMILGLAVMRAKPFAPGELGETVTISQEF